MSWSNYFRTEYQNSVSCYQYIEFFNVCFPTASLPGRWGEQMPPPDAPQPLYFPPVTSLDVPPESSAQRAIRRAKKVVKDLCFLNFTQNVRFLTLTYAGDGCHDRRQAQKDIKACIRRLRENEEVEIKYVGVFEEHKTGHGLHAHLILNCSYYKNEDFAAWFWKKGFVKLEKIKTSPGEDGLVNVCEYLLKYLSKDLENYVPRLPMYFCSRNLKRYKKVVASELEIEHLEGIISRYLVEGYQKVYEKQIELPALGIKKVVIILRYDFPYAKEEFFVNSPQKYLDNLLRC